MRTLTITALIVLAIGLYPGHAERLVHAAERVVCSVFPAQDRSVIELIIILVAIVAVSQWSPNK